MNVEEKLKVALQLEKLGVNIIEAGFPITSKGEKEAIRLIAAENLKCEVSGLARLEKSDIDSVIECGVKVAHLFIATSDIHLEHKLKISRNEALEKIEWAVNYAKTKGLIVEFSAEDATRSNNDYLVDAFSKAVDSGADRIDIPDTVGVMTPTTMYQLVKKIDENIKVPISVHCHDDFGLAVANSIAGIEAGAQRIHVCVNGLGERSGNASLEEIVMALYCLYNHKTNITSEHIYETSKLVSNLTGVIVQPNKAIVGANAFAHEAGIHQDLSLIHI